MPDLDNLTELLIGSEHIDEDELSQTADLLRRAGRYDLIDRLTAGLLLKHGDNDTVLLMRAWYLTDIEHRYADAGNILRTTERDDNAMHVVLRATITLKTSYDAYTADDILETFTTANPETLNEVAIEAARLFVSEQYTDLAEKWIMKYHGQEDYDYLMVHAEVMMQKEEYAEASDLYRKVLRTEPADTDAWNRLTDAYINRKEYETAVDTARHSLAIDGNFKAQENIRLCMLCMNRHNKKTFNNQKHK